MAYNSVRYDISAFNYNDAGDVRYIVAIGSEKISPAVGTNLQAFISAIGNERVSRETSGSLGWFTLGSGSEQISEQVADAVGIVWTNVAGAEYVATTTGYSLDLIISAQMVETVDARTALGKNIHLTETTSEIIASEITIGQKVFPAMAGFELVAVSASIEAIDTIICYLGTSTSPFTLQPGSRLVIDAGTYNVLLNDQNAIHIQSGAWVDELVPETINLAVTASSGASNLEAMILYTEKYL